MAAVAHLEWLLPRCWPQRGGMAGPPTPRAGRSPALPGTGFICVHLNIPVLFGAQEAPPHSLWARKYLLLPPLWSLALPVAGARAHSPLPEASPSMVASQVRGVPQAAPECWNCRGNSQ